MPAMALAGPAHEEMTAIEAQRALAGTWVGDGTTLIVDTQRLQVNVDPDKPFDWRSLTLVNVSGKMVVFRVGPMPYIALFANRTAMTLTSPSFLGERTLRRRGGNPLLLLRQAPGPRFSAPR